MRNLVSQRVSLNLNSGFADDEQFARGVDSARPRIQRSLLLERLPSRRAFKKMKMWHFRSIAAVSRSNSFANQPCSRIPPRRKPAWPRSVEKVIQQIRRISSACFHRCANFRAALPSEKYSCPKVCRKRPPARRSSATSPDPPRPRQSGKSRAQAV